MWYCGGEKQNEQDCTTCRRSRPSESISSPRASKFRCRIHIRRTHLFEIVLQEFQDSVKAYILIFLPPYGTELGKLSPRDQMWPSNLLIQPLGLSPGHKPSLTLLCTLLKSLCLSGMHPMHYMICGNTSSMPQLKIEKSLCRNSELLHGWKVSGSTKSQLCWYAQVYL